MSVNEELDLAEHIRKVNGNNRMGAAALAESIIEWQAAKSDSAQQGNTSEETVENWRHDSEELEALHRNFDDVGVPRAAETGEIYSAWGRALRFKSMTQQGGVPVRDADFADEFQAWWDDHGQFVRSGGGNYERTFAFEAWRYLYPKTICTRPQSAGVPEGFVLMPESLTAENGAKYALSGEFHEVVELGCTACDEDEDDCEVCSGHGSYTYRVPISWTAIKDIYSLAVSKCSAATTPQPAGDWVPRRDCCPSTKSWKNCPIHGPQPPRGDQ